MKVHVQNEGKCRTIHCGSKLYFDLIVGSKSARLLPLHICTYFDVVVRYEFVLISCYYRGEDFYLSII